MNDTLQQITSGNLPVGHIRWRMRYGTFVSEAYKVMYMETPKNACTTTKHVYSELQGIERLEDPHTRKDRDIRPSIMQFTLKQRKQILCSSDYYRFCVLRNPVKRLISGYKNKIVRDVKNPSIIEFYKAILDSKNLNDKNDITFDIFANYILDQPDSDRNAHWMSQTSLTLVNDIDYNFIVTLENYSRDMAHVLKEINAPQEIQNSIVKIHNSSNKNKIYVSPELTSRIEQEYALDMEFHSAALMRNDKLLRT